MLLLTPGPVQTDPRVRAAAAVDIAPWDEDFRPEYARLRDRVRAVAGGLPGEHVTLPLQGAGHFIVEAAIRSLIPAGGRFVVPMNGTYAARVERLAREAGRIAIPIPVPDTRPATAAEVAEALAAHPDATHLVAVHSETGSGIVNDPAVLGPAVRAAGRRMILDSVSGFGALPFRMADHPECDAAVFTSNKCIEGLPGLGFAVCRDAPVRAGAGQAGSWSLDLGDVLLHAERSGWGSFRFTPPVQALRAFGVALDLYEAEGGQPARLRRYQENARVLLDGAAALGMRPYLEARHQGPIIATFHQPKRPGFELQHLVDALKRRGVLISNFWTTARPTFRIGCIGAVTPAEMRGAVAALGEALRELGLPLPAAA
ncbi:2-aminoethylphosphonate--pyruvate transaminase [Roseomonas sp. BN140053]|uniref:2-aminoethylphosphonate--pyruvate transaminase n=1 Tax=Roseomonas sp. BN140053 TaxID=3391898 RepID=UPI0039E86C2B